MSSNTKKPGDAANWSMPEPVFRSSEGTPLKNAAERLKRSSSPGPEGSAKAENIMENEHEIAEKTVDPQGETAAGKHERGDNLMMSMTAVGVLSLIAVAIILVLFYFLFYRSATGAP